MPAIRSQARRHRSAAGELVRRQAHDGHLLEAAVPVHGQQLDLHPAVLQCGHQDQVLVAAAGDVLHEVLLVGLLQNGVHLAVFVGIDSQIAVPLRGQIAHHQLHSVSVLQLRQPDIVHRVSQTLDGLLHLPRACGILLQKGDADVGGLGGRVEHGGVLFAVAVQILQQKGRKQLPLHGVFELRTLAQPVVQGTLQRTVIARKARSAQQILDLHVVRHGEAAPRQQPQQAAGRKRQEVSSFQPQSLLSVENSRLRIQYPV